MDPKPAISSKTILVNAGVLYAIKICKYFGIEVPTDLILEGLALGNIILRLVTGAPISSGLGQLPAMFFPGKQGDPQKG